jgi:uncharacterized phage-like protein YoqJ
MHFNIDKAWCFTGHRPHKLYGYNKYDKGNKKIREMLKDEIIYCIEVYNAKYFISGMALGIDQWGAEIVLDLQRAYPDIKLIAAIPCANQASGWPVHSQIEWKNIVDESDFVHYVSSATFNNYCLQRRNEWMVNNSCGQIAVWDGTKGGTANCIKYAMKKEKNNRITIHPKMFKVHRESNA